jgi:hypothetical protein
MRRIETDLAVPHEWCQQGVRSGNVLRAGIQGCARVVPEIDLVRLEFGHDRLFVGNCEIVDFLEFGRTAPIIRVRDHSNLLAAMPRQHFEGARAHRRTVERNAIEIGIGREQVARVHRDRDRRLRQERRDEWCIRTIETHDDRRCIEPVDPHDMRVRRSVPHVGARVHDGVPGKDHVVGREGFAVVPTHAAAQMIGDREAIARDPAVG